MPQVMGGEGGLDKAAAQWSCAECADAGKAFTDEEAQVIFHCVKAHGAYDVSRDTVNKVVRVQSTQT